MGSENYLTDRDDLGRGGVAEPAIWDRKRFQGDRLGQVFGRPAAEAGDGNLFLDSGPVSAYGTGFRRNDDDGDCFAGRIYPLYNADGFGVRACGKHRGVEMGLETIAILSPGDMGHGVGKVLVERGYKVITCLAGRSRRTADLSAAAGILDVPSLEEMVAQADLITSILVPSQAVGVAREAADAMRAAGAARPFADCNAVSPESAAAMASIIGEAGGDYIDGGIIGGSPARGAVPRIYTSGPRAGLMDELDGKGIAVKNLGSRVGQSVGHEDVLCVDDERDERAPGGDADRFGLARTVRRADRRARVQPRRGAFRHGVRNTGTPRQRGPLDRRDGGDRADLRGGRG